MSIKIGLIAFDGVEELDLVGPWEVFSAAGYLREDVQCEIVSFDGQGVSAAKGMYFGVHGAMDEAAVYDVLLLPGGKGTRTLMKQPDFLATLKRIAERATWVTSVCTGSLVYAHLGLLNGRQSTTHHLSLDTLESFENVGEVVRNKRYVRDGRYVTSAGVSAGIDMALWLLGEIKGEKFAQEVQRYIEYHPVPPFGNTVIQQ